MSFRLPQNLSTGLARETTDSLLNREILAEKAAALGRAGKLAARRLDALQSSADPAARPGLIRAAADAVYGLLVQRELCGLTDHQAVIEDYDVPGEVVARLGAR